MTGFVPDEVRNRGELPDPDYRRALADARRFARQNRARLDAEWNALPDGRPWRIADYAASLSPERRAEIEKEWSRG